jgi:glycosyltransferase involved in cell wall biosynthesis
MADDVTVIVVGYNHGRFIEKCLDSIAAQTLQPSRVIVMDDASPDQTGEVATAWSARTGYDIDVRINPTNVGLCATLNRALDTITTPFYAYISGDDHMESNRLAEQVPAMRAAPPDCAAVYSDAFIEDEHGARTGVLASEHFGWPEVLEGSHEVYDQMLNENWIPAPSVLLRTEAVKGVGGYDPDLYFEDLDLWLRLLGRGHSFRCVSRPLVTFRVHSASLGSTTFHHENLRFIQALRIILHKQLVGASPRHRATVERKLWWLAVRSAKLGVRSKSVVRDLFVLRHSAGLAHPLRASASAVARGLFSAGH